jgi:putative phosphoribosyl transferase
MRQDPFEAFSDDALFEDRREAGRRLAAKLQTYAPVAREGKLLVLALPPGGVPVAYEVAGALAAPLDVLIVRKLRVPGHEGLAMGAIASGRIRLVNTGLIRGLRIPAGVVDAAAMREAVILRERELTYRGDRPWPSLKGRTVILIDDGLASGATMRAAIVAVRQQDPARIVVGVPVGSAEQCAEIHAEVDEIVCAEEPPSLLGVSPWYRDPAQTTDAEVRELVARAKTSAPGR